MNSPMVKLIINSIKLNPCSVDLYLRISNLGLEFERLID
ncbi:hypothetical protein ADIMK_1042 [Marinobacterium lacunae]|uniref:Uncharacterized protein n=1 Tax=Marinobacterium lacunae TaxID=1232683 RepID=A0A081G1D4_9GAMM|nr:hypothetical protein ADIMK_1042 [Marinobacterium lacunae]